jgi:hypothetical protein
MRTSAVTEDKVQVMRSNGKLGQSSTYARYRCYLDEARHREVEGEDKREHPERWVEYRLSR